MTASDRLSPAGPGWCLVRSSVLEDTVLWIRDERTSFPRQPKGRVVYTLAELDLLLDQDATAADLRALHTIKRTFPGAVAVQDPVRHAEDRQHGLQPSQGAGPFEGWGEVVAPMAGPAAPPAAADPFADWDSPNV